ncbi:MAG TPA: calcium-binding EGF-like domain-containing protein [Vicinamibacterales bacterium]|nr:calcium-binding EGF-like domain-containing protein [Vicinamibacterales bacterium]
MFRQAPRWLVQSAIGVALVLSLNFVTGGAAATDEAQTAGPAAKTGGCEPGYSGSPETGCVDVNECAVSNGGCHRLTACENTPGSRTCGGCPKDYAGDGYVGCFDVNECASPDCSDRLPSGADNPAPPVVSTSGDVTVAATSSGGAAATFTATAKDAVDGSRPVNCSPASGSTFKVGKTTVTCWAFNKRGKIGRSTLTVTVTQ